MRLRPFAPRTAPGWRRHPAARPVEPEEEVPALVHGMRDGSSAAAPRHDKDHAGEGRGRPGGSMTWGYVPSMKPPPRTARTDATATTT